MVKRRYRGRARATARHGGTSDGKGVDVRPTQKDILIVREVAGSLQMAPYTGTERTYDEPSDEMGVAVPEKLTRKI